MEYNITLSQDGKYISIKTKGDITRTEAMKQNIEAHTLGRKLGIRRYLVDLTESRNVESVVDDYEFVHEDLQAEPVFDRFARVALLVSPDDRSHDFFATASLNAGMSVHLFTSFEEAVQFLTNDSPSRNNRER